MTPAISDTRVSFILTGDPHPKSTEPRFVKEAYTGLKLISSRKIDPGVTDHLPRGAFLVRLSEFLRALAAHNNEASAWAEATWNRIAQDAKQITKNETELVFGCEHCEVIQ